MASRRQSLAVVALVSAVLAACDGGPSNTPPSAAFAAQCGTLSCTFTNSSTDADGEIAAYQWDFGDSTDVATSRDAVHSYTKAGQFEVTLRVTDDGGETAATTVPVDVKGTAFNNAPHASFRVSCTELTCSFSDESFDPDAGGRVVSYVWDFGDGSPGVTSRDAVHTYPAQGTYHLRLTVRDDAGAHGFTTRDLNVIGPPTAPEASFTYGCVELTCSFTDHSYDLDGSVVSWSWNFGDGQTSTDPSPEHTFAGPGAYTVTLGVTDNSARVGQFTTMVVAPPPPPTTFEFSVTCTGHFCRFKDETTPPNGPWVSWFWNFGDGELGDGRDVIHEYATGGTYTVSLTVWDFDLGGGSVTHEVTVTP